MKNIDEKIAQLKRLKLYKYYIRKHQFEEVERLSSSINKKQNEISKLREEFITERRRGRGYPNPKERELAGEGFVMPGSHEDERILLREHC